MKSYPIGTLVYYFGTIQVKNEQSVTPKNRVFKAVPPRDPKTHCGPSDTLTIDVVQNLVNALGKSRQYAEAKALLREQIPNMRQLGPDHTSTISLRLLLAMCLDEDNNATRGDIEESVTILEDVDRRARRVLGGNHPLAAQVHGALERARRNLANRDPGGLR